MSRRFLFVINSLFPLGPAQQFLLLARHLIVNDYDVHVAVLDNRENDPILAGLNVHHLRKVEHRDSGLTLRLRRLIRKLKPDIVHSWCEPAISLCGAAMFELEDTRLISTELRINEEPSFLNKQLQRRFHCRPEKFTVPHPVLRDIKLRDGIRDHRLVVVPTAAFHSPHDQNEARQLLRERFDLPPDSLVAGAFANFEPRTRMKDLIWAADLLAIIRDDFHFVLFGEGEQEDRLKKFLSQTEAAPIVHFAGTPPDAAKLLCGLNFFWNAHLLKPLDGILMSAMDANIPVVSVFGDGLKEIIIPQTTGLATNFGGRDEFARWTKYLIEMPDAASQLAAQGRAHVQKEFPLSQMIGGFEKIYNWCQ